MGYRERQAAHIIAVCDSNRKRAREKASAWDVDRVYTDYDELLADPIFDEEHSFVGPAGYGLWDRLA